MAACVTVPLGPACVNITGIRAGDRNEMTFTVMSKGAPVDLTGMTVTAQARKKATDPDPAALEAVVDITDPVNGTGTLRWPGDDVRTLLGSSAKWTGVWDLQVGDGVSDPTTIAAGSFDAVSDVTR